jgi:HAD superfamily hydrolase (TIGR01450 family)
LFPVNAKTFVFDLDGVLYLGETAIPGTAQTIAALRRAEKDIYFLTNNSSRSRADYVDKLAGMDIQTDAAHMFTSGYATAIYLAERGAKGANAYIIGESGIIGELDAVGVHPITAVDKLSYSQIDYVVVGIDRQFSYDKLHFAHAAITRGHAAFIATNRDATFPMEEGSIPGEVTPSSSANPSRSLLPPSSTPRGRFPNTAS